MADPAVTTLRPRVMLRPSVDPTDGQVLVADSNVDATEGGAVWKTLTKPSILQLHAAGDAAAVWTSQPAADTFFLGSHRHVAKVDLTDMVQVRLIVNKQAVAANTSATLALRYKATSFSTTVGDYSTIGTSAVQVGIDTTDAVLDSGWIALASGAKGDVFIAVVGNGGNASISPEFGTVVAEFR